VASAVVYRTGDSRSATDSLERRYTRRHSGNAHRHSVTYRFASSEWSSGDAWKDGSTVSNHRSVAAIIRAAYSMTQNTYPNIVAGGADYAYVTPIFYTSGGTVATPTFSPASPKSFSGRT